MNDTATRTEPTANALAQLTPERRARAKALQSAMADRFSTDERELTAEDFGVVFVGDDDERRAVVMLTADTGLYLGSYNSIMSDNDYIVDVDGERVDTRTAMTWETYQAFIGDAEARGVELLPDSAAASERNGVFWTVTWLTGDPPCDDGAYCGTVDRIGAGRTWYNRYAVWRPVRFRPSAQV